MPKRLVFQVRWQRGRGWECKLPNGTLQEATHLRKGPFIQQLAAQLRRGWQHGGTLSQLKVFGKNGRLQFERTYGRDPKRFRG